MTSCEPKHGDVNASRDYFRFQMLSAKDVTLPKPQYGDWLDQHFEPGQTFDQYIKSNPVMTTKTRRTIYLQPIGVFSKQQERVIAYTAEYLRCFYMLDVVTSPVISDTIIPKKARRIRGSEQLNTSYIMYDILEKNIPNDAIVVMAITEKDLYPADSWYFVFGQANLKKRIGVSSIYRFTDAPLDSGNYQQCLNRLIKTSSHEIGHMFSIEHCIHAKCLMNGSNSLPEADGTPNRLCSECHKKIYWNLQFDMMERMKLLRDYFQQYHLQDDYNLIDADLAVCESRKEK